ncbi:hypothetical protein ACFPN2_38370 [Steroidobacter flavus]|uniref:Uncharacterized protein n=1 Tax=Steroidobacter flavus TaxID=1842136 RepID=A0ABV8T6E0_9GAMM
MDKLIREVLIAAVCVMFGGVGIAETSEERREIKGQGFMERGG